MKRFILLGALIAVASLALPHSALAFGWKDVIRMHQDGVADSLIIQKIEHSGKSFSLSPDQIHKLMEADVSDDVISAMLQTEDRGDYGGYDPYRSGYGNSHPRVYVGLGLRYYDDWYYGWPYYGYGPYGYGGYYSRYYTPHYRGYTPYSGYRRYGSNYGTMRERTYVNPGTGYGHPRPAGPSTRRR
jgi:hypothetical protein